MVQAEVADRLAAPPGSKTYGVPVGQGGLVRRRTPRRLHRPQRLLAGAQRRLRPRGLDPPRPAGDDRHPRAGLRRRRRRLRPAPQDSCAPRCARSPAPSEAAEAALAHAGIDPTARGEVLDVERLRPDRRGHAVAEPRERAAAMAAPSASASASPPAEDQPAPRGRGRPRGRLPPARDRLPGDRPVRRGQVATADGAPRVTVAGRRTSTSPTCPLDEDQHRRSGPPRCWPRTHRTRPGRRLHDPQGDPGRRRHGRRLAPTRPPPCSPSTGSGTPSRPTTSSSSSRPSSAATCPSRSSAAPRSAPGRGELVTPVTTAAVVVGRRALRRRRALHARGLPALRPAVPRRGRPSPRVPTPCWPRWPRGRPAPARRRAAQRPPGAGPRPAARPRRPARPRRVRGRDRAASCRGSGPTCLFLAESPDRRARAGRGAARPRPRGRARRRRPGPGRPVVEVG